MSTIQIDIIDPKAAKLLRDLEEMNLISIRKPNKSSFLAVLEKTRKKEKSAPSLDEITKEVEAVRTKRYGK